MTVLAVAAAVVAGVPALIAGVLLLLRLELWLKARRERALDDTQEIDIADLFGEANRALQADFEARREVHGMTVPELMAVRSEFDGIIRASWPDQT